MSVDPFDHFRWLKKTLSGSSPEVRAAFAAACVQRVVPAYRAFAETHGTGDPEEFEALVDMMWSTIRSPLGPPDSRLEDALERAEAMYEEGGEPASYSGHGANAVVCLCAALDSLTGSPDSARQASSEASAIIDNYVLANSVPGVAGPEESEEAMRHPLCVAERERQRRDLTSLSQMDFRTWSKALRKSAEKDGKLFFGEGWLDEVDEE